MQHFVVLTSTSHVQQIKRAPQHVCQLKPFLFPDVRVGGPDRVGEDRLIENRHEGKWCLTSSDFWFAPKGFFSFLSFPWRIKALTAHKLLSCSKSHQSFGYFTAMLLLETKHGVSLRNLMSNVKAALEEIQTLLLMWENILVCQTTVVLTTIRSLDSLTIWPRVRQIVSAALYRVSRWC